MQSVFVFRFGDRKCCFPDIAIRTFYVKSRESPYLGNGTSDHQNEKAKTLCNTKYPPKPGKTHLRNHFWPLKSGFSAIATYKTYVFSKSSNVPILKFFLVIPDTFSIPKSLTEVMGDLIFLKTRSRPMCSSHSIIADILLNFINGTFRPSFAVKGACYTLC